MYLKLDYLGHLVSKFQMSLIITYLATTVSICDLGRSLRGEKWQILFWTGRFTMHLGTKIT